MKRRMFLKVVGWASILTPIVPAVVKAENITPVSASPQNELIRFVMWKVDTGIRTEVVLYPNVIDKKYLRQAHQAASYMQGTIPRESYVKTLRSFGAAA